MFFMKVLLVAPPKLGLYGSELFPPIGLGYIATKIKTIGCTVDIKDCLILNWDHTRLLEYIDQEKPDLVGFTLFSQAFPMVNQILKGIKQAHPSIITVVGGPHPTALPGKVLQELPEADYACNGEGEFTLLKLIQKLKGEPIAYQDIPGLIWRENGTCCFNPKLEYEPIDDFGMPAWDLINPTLYNTHKVNLEPHSSIIHTSRGCPFPCRFCVRLGKRLRHRSIEHIYAEMTYLNQNYGITVFYLGDEGFPIQKKFVKDFCRFMIEKNDGYSFYAACGIRLNTLDAEMLELMKQAHFQRLLAVGIESCVPRVRNGLMNKSLSQEELINGLNLLNKHGFKPAGNFIIGYPGETAEEINETIRIALRLPLWGAAFTPFMPLPGSEETKALIEKGEISPDFDYTRIHLDSVLYAPPGMTPAQVDALRQKAVFRFNIRPRILFGYHLHPRRIGWTIVKFFRIFVPTRFLPQAIKRKIA
jgi:radical SAM superfamily enzyme YgiQ (UPF0313 family)